EKAVLFGVGSGHCFNFLNWMLNNAPDGMFIPNLVGLLFQVSEIVSRNLGQGGAHDDFFHGSLLMLLQDLLRTQIEKHGKVDILALLNMAQDLPKSPEAAADKNSAIVQLIDDALKNNPNSPEMQQAHKYLLQSWPNLAEKTRSCILQSLEVLLK